MLHDSGQPTDETDPPSPAKNDDNRRDPAEQIVTSHQESNDSTDGSSQTDPGAPARESTPDEQADGSTRPWWERTLDGRRVPPMIRRIAERRINEALAKQSEQYFADRDPDANASTRLPDGEHVRVPIIWLAELFTPTTVNGLIDGMRVLADKVKGTLGSEEDFTDWILSSRRTGMTAWKNVHYIFPKGSKGFLAPHYEDNLPPGIASIHLSLYTLTSTITVLTTAFRLEDSRALELEAILNKDRTTRAERRQRPRGFKLRTVEEQKQTNIAEWQANLRQEAAQWISERFPGSFHKLPLGNSR